MFEQKIAQLDLMVRLILLHETDHIFLSRMQSWMVF